MSGPGAWRAALASLLAALALALVAGSEASAGVLGPTPERAAELGEQAYLYGFPLLEFARVRKEQTSVACPDALTVSCHSLVGPSAVQHIMPVLS